MNKDYDKKFNAEIESLLKEVYDDPIYKGKQKMKRAVVEIDAKHMSFLIKNKLIKIINNAGGGKYGVQLESNGYEVFEKYDGWNNYKKKVLDKKEKVQNAKDLASKYWWIPILISVVALIISGIALFANNN